MRLPRHKNPSRQVAVAPYNFVPLPDVVVTFDPESLPDQGLYHADLYTGTIDCLLTTSSPTYVRSPLTPDEFQQQEKDKDKEAKDRPDFFHTDPVKTPRIPGSSLRGMLRSLVEIAGYGKMEYVSDRRLVYRAVGDTTNHGEAYRERIMHLDDEGLNQSGKRCKRYTPLVRAGYMKRDENGDWWIQPARQIGGTTFARINKDKIPSGLEKIPGCKNAERIYIQPGPYEYQEVRGGFLQVRASRVVRVSKQEGSGLIAGTLARSGAMASKRNEAVVFPPKEGVDGIRIDDEMVRDYRDQVSKEQAELLGGKEGVLRDGQPVFYLMEDGKLVFFGHTMMLRLPYKKPPLEFVPQTLRDPSHVDMAEAIFGYTKKTGEGRSRAYAGRVMVGDAMLEPGQGDIWLDPGGVTIPQILGSPKPTTFQHYLVQQTPDPVRAGTTRDGKPKFQKNLSDYAADTPGETVLRGHKLYWHKGAVTKDDIEEDPDKLRGKEGQPKADTQHTQIRPVAAGVRFRFQVHFENLSTEELGALLWVLTLPGAPGKEYRHSIGMGKPYGMGAVQIKPTLYLSERKQRYASLLDDEGQWHKAIREVPDSEVSTYASSFDEFIRSKIGAQKATCLAEMKRIAMLFALLEWPGPQPHQEVTRYLEIEHPDPAAKRGKINEYRDRPVLPDPLAVLAGQPVRKATPPAATGRVPQRAAPPGTRTGTIKWFNETKGYGFIAQEGEEDIFFHKNSVADYRPGLLQEGKRVSYSVGQGRRGLQAENVQVL